MTAPGIARPTEMARAYEAQQIEERLYAWWQDSGWFQPADDAARAPFVVSMPPPNVTGELHMGHAMFVTLEDVLVRWRRMCGDAALWLPGTDHAGIATQSQVEKLLRSEGSSREAVGREEFLRRTWAWKARYGGEITRQLRRLGASCDWSRERFTLDPGLSYAVRAAFKRLYDDGLIYRGTYLVNWSPALQTAVSDLEVEHEERQVSLAHLRYPLVPLDGPPPGAAPWGSGAWAAPATEFITVATTRPETLMGDTAVAVNPADERYQALIGRDVLLPVVGRRIPIIADEYADPAFGSGAVKITPAHDPNDYQVALRHGLPMINVMNRDATLNEHAGCYAGLERFAARRAVLADLEREGLLAGMQPHTMSVGISQRGGEIIEPLLSEQWFVRARPLAELAAAAVRDGAVRIVPERFEKVYFHWMDTIQDWCISRQLWWGHRIPVWYAADGTMIVPGPDDPEPQGPGITQDPDVLDTWFSSGLWPFSTLGWPHATADLQRFYPTSVMETGYDILFFWVARMMMLGCYLTGQAPFHTIYLHGLVRDRDGRKMSKSYGNVVNPLEVMDQYGTDALRYTLATSSTPGQDLNLNPERIETARNFANKIWNVTRFVLTKCDEVAAVEPAPATLADRWILAGYDRCCGEVQRLLSACHFGEAGRRIHEFFWSELADWYVEVAKVQLEGDAPRRAATQQTLLRVLEGSLRLLHPFMPFVTEEAWQYLTRAVRQMWPDRALPPSVMIADYPQAADLDDDAALRGFALVQEIIRGIRNVRNEYRVEPARWVAVSIAAGAQAGLLETQRALIGRLARVADGHLDIVPAFATPPRAAATVVIGSVEVSLPLAGLIDLAAERARLARELDAADADVARREARLGSEQFVARAPAAVVQRERDGLAAARDAVARLRQRLDDVSDPA